MIRTNCVHPQDNFFVVLVLKRFQNTLSLWKLRAMKAGLRIYSLCTYNMIVLITSYKTCYQKKTK